MKMFPNKLWNKSSIDRLIRKIDIDGDTRRRAGSGRPKSVRTVENIALVDDLICSQESKPHSHKSPRKIARQTGISHSSVRRIVKRLKPESLQTRYRMKTAELNASRDVSSCYSGFRTKEASGKSGLLMKKFFR